nr:protein YzcX [Shigella flexneri]
MQRFLAVDNDFAAIFKGNGQYAAVDFAVDIAVAIPVVQAFLNGQPELISQAMKFTVVHCCILFLSDGGSIAVWGQGFKVCTSAAAFRHDSSVTGIMMSLCSERFVSSLGRSYTTSFPVSGKHYDQVYRASILTLTELKKTTNKPHCDSA